MIQQFLNWLTNKPNHKVVKATPPYGLEHLEEIPAERWFN